MWGRKRPDTSTSADAGPRNLNADHPSKSAFSSREEATEVNEVTRPAGTTAACQTSWLGLGLHLKGEICGNVDLLIDGSVEGLVHLDDRNLTVGRTAKVTADIIAGELVVYGEVKGNVRATGKIEIKKEGSVTGDLATPQILIEDGAYFKGSIEIEKSTEKNAGKNALPPAA